MKKEMTSFDIAAFVPELNEALRGARIENVYRIGTLTFLLRLHKPNQPPLQLLIEAGRRLHLTSYVLKKPAKPPTFCMALRKYLRNGKIHEIHQHEFERIVVIVVTTKEGEFRLVCELFGQGNIILVSPENKILQALTFRRMRDRNILRGEIFKHAPMMGRNPIALDLQNFGEIKRFGRLEIVKALTKFLGIGGFYAEEILIRAQIEKNTPCEALTEQQIREMFEQLQQILLPIKAGKLEPGVIMDEKGELIDAVPISLRKYADFEKREYATFNEALDECYTKTAIEEKAVKATQKLEEMLAKEQRILQSQQKNLEEQRLKVEQNRKVGNSVFSHLGELQIFLQRILDEKKSGKSWEQIIPNITSEKAEGKVPAVYFNALEPQSFIRVSVDDQTFLMDIQSSAQVNGAEYYAKAKKAQGKLKGIEQALQETHRRIEEVRRQWIEAEEKTSEPPPKRPKKAWYEKFRWFHSSGDFLVVGGRDATTNEILIKKHMEEHDAVFHADIIGAPFVLIKTEGKNSSEQTLWEAAQFAAAYSQAWKKSLGAVNVYWFSPQQISKSPPSGQYLKKGSFMVHGQKHYIRNVPLRVAIGIIADEEQLKVVGGPLEAISKRANAYVEIVPGEQPSGKLAKQIRQHLTEKLPETLRKKVLEISLEEIQRFIPSGKGESLS